MESGSLFVSFLFLIRYEKGSAFFILARLLLLG
jgi:hypothetical protein